MKTLAFLLIAGGIVLWLADDEPEPQRPLPKLLGDSLQSELEELERLQSQIHQEARR